MAKRKSPKTTKPEVSAEVQPPSPPEVEKPRERRLRVAITGATGTLGRALAERLISRGDSVIALTRDPARAEEVLRGAEKYVQWNGINIGPWVNALDGVDAVLHLAGAPLITPDGGTTRQEFQRSRVMSTRAIVEGLGGLRVKPSVFLSASTVQVYGGARRETITVDDRAFPGSDVAAKALREWEQAALGAREHEIRTVLLRFGMVLSANAGTLPLLVKLFERRLGGPILPARGWRPWIHLEDAVELMILAMTDERIVGGINLTAPEPVTSAEFSRQLGRAVGHASWMPLPRALVRRLLGSAAASQLQLGRRVVPSRALELGYTFHHPQLAGALTDLVRYRREESREAAGFQSQPT